MARKGRRDGVTGEGFNAGLVEDSGFPQRALDRVGGSRLDVFVMSEGYGDWMWEW